MNYINLIINKNSILYNMSVNNFGLHSNNSKPDVSKKDLDSKFIVLTKNLQTKVDKAGDVMTGDLNMGSNKITCTCIPNADEVLTNKGYVDSKLSKAGDTMTGELNMNGQQIIGLKNPTDDDEACNKKYVDLKAAELKSESSLKPIYFNTLMNNLTIHSKLGYVPILNSNLDSKYGFKVTTSSEQPESKQAYNAFTYKKNEWITNGVNRNFWIQIQCPEGIKIWRFALRGKGSGQDCIYKWRLQGKNNNEYTNWNDIYTANNDPINNVMKYFDVSPNEGYINYRIFVEEAEGQNPGLSYWQLYTVDNVVAMSSE
jgi:hypothetical protein